MICKNALLGIFCIATPLFAFKVSALEIDTESAISPAVSASYGDINNLLINSEVESVVVPASAFKWKLRASRSLKTDTFSINAFANNAITAEALEEEAPYEPRCPTLSTNELYTLNGTTTGNVSCYHFSIKERAKTTIVLLNQSVGTDHTLNVLRDIDGTLTLIATSNQPDNTDEIIKMMAEPGEYYWYIQTNTANNATIQFATIEATNVDKYEVNDASDVSKQLTGIRNFVMGNHEDGNDIDYFHYQLPVDDSIDIKLNDMESSGQWILEVNVNNVWQALTTGGLNSNFHTFTNQTAGTLVQIRVRPNPAVTQDATKYYRLTIGASQKAAQYRITRQFSGLVATGERVNRQAQFSPPTGYDDLISLVDIAYVNQTGAINCDLELLNKSNRKFASDKCGRSRQTILNRSNVSPVTLKYSIYHADFANQTTRQS